LKEILNKEVNVLPTDFLVLSMLETYESHNLIASLDNTFNYITLLGVKLKVLNLLGIRFGHGLIGLFKPYIIVGKLANTLN
jgi:hypothetical protein